MQAIQDQQEIMGAIADMVIETYAMESAVLRAQKLAARNGEAESGLAIAMTRVYLAGAIEKIESAARRIVAAVSRGRHAAIADGDPAPPGEVRPCQHDCPAADRSRKESSKRVST